MCVNECVFASVSLRLRVSVTVSIIASVPVFASVSVSVLPPLRRVIVDESSVFCSRS